MKLLPRSKFWVERGGEVVLSDWRVQLLEAVVETGSVAGAAHRLHISYRRAWGKVKEMEERLGLRLLVSQRGGRGGGRTRLTPEAEELVKSYRKFRAGLKELVDWRFGEAFPSA